MAKYDKKAALKIMVEAARKYEEKLNDKHFLIVYREERDTKTASVGFRTGKKTDFPVTLYNEDVRKLSQPTNKVLAIFSKHYKNPYYDNCIYLAKNQSIQGLKMSDEVLEMIFVDKA